MVGMAVWRQIEAGTVKCLLQLQAATLKDGVTFHLFIAQGDALVSRARSRLATGFLMTTAPRFDALLMIDGDVLFNPNEALRMAKRAHHLGVVMGGMYVTRSNPPQPASQLPVGVPVTFAPGAEPVEAPYVAGGFMAIPRTVLERVKPDVEMSCEGSDLDFLNYFGPFMHESVYLGEDYSFCLRARRAGCRVYLDPSVALKHVGDHAYGLSDLLERRPADGPVTLTLDAERHLTATR